MNLCSLSDATYLKSSKSELIAESLHACTIIVAETEEIMAQVVVPGVACAVPSG
jgi:hypothetical protein